MVEVLPVVDGWDLPTFWGVPALCVWQAVCSELTGGPAAYLAYLKKLTWDTWDVDVYSAVLIRLWKQCHWISNQNVCALLAVKKKKTKKTKTDINLKSLAFPKYYEYA